MRAKLVKIPLGFTITQMGNVNIKALKMGGGNNAGHHSFIWN